LSSFFSLLEFTCSARDSFFGGKLKLLEYLCNGGGSARLGQRARNVRGTAREFDLEYEPQLDIAGRGIGCPTHTALNGSTPNGVGRLLPVLHFVPFQSGKKLFEPSTLMKAQARHRIKFMQATSPICMCKDGPCTTG
jgi:hypothetical protein